MRIGDKYAALRRVASKDDIRSNIHAGGSAEAVEIGKTELEVAETIRPKLVADGMFLVGIDIVGDKILEVNVFSPGNLQRCSQLAGVDFSVPIIEAIERKLAIAKDFAGRVRQSRAGEPLIGATSRAGLDPVTIRFHDAGDC